MPDDLNNNNVTEDPANLPPGEPAKNETTDSAAADAAATEAAAKEAAIKEAADKAEAAVKEAAAKEAAAKEAADKAAAEAAVKEAAVKEAAVKEAAVKEAAAKEAAAKEAADKAAAEAAVKEAAAKEAAAKEAADKAAAEAAVKEAAAKEAAAKEAADKAAAEAAVKEAAAKEAADKKAAVDAAAKKDADEVDKTDSADGKGKGATDQSRLAPPKSKIFTWLTVGQYFVLGVIGLIIVWFLFSGVVGANSGSLLFALAKPEVARGVITFLVAAGTVSLAVLLVMAAIMSSGSQDLDDRFAFGKEVLTLLIGILGTIVGFYYGSTKENAAPVTLSPVSLSEPAPKIGEKFTLDAVVIGGSPPYTYSIKFNPTGIIPDVIDQQSAGKIHHEFTIPTDKGKPGAVVTFTIDVKDAKDQALTYNKDGKQSINLQAATATPPSP